MASERVNSIPLLFFFLPLLISTTLGNMAEDRVNRRTRKAEPAPAAAAAAEDKEPKRAQRTTSNVFAVLNQNQIQEFKEVEQ
ncbi:hypothetical protein EB796_022257 [Bugula neritina]|uniref:Uncharacterized protein n=1 Tax=Bugula neritina TaxID=10212 RepID=A0A7J7IZX6_BUGNE|nr:hypothetical protein EB796_022257 [Bugula neritina]